MAAHDLATALRRAETVLQRRPAAGLHDDATGIARWDGGTRIMASHANGYRMVTDMPSEIGGSGDQVSPGWMVRSGLAACTATCIAMAAAREGLELDALEVRVASRSDMRGLLGMREADGRPVDPGPVELSLHVSIAAAGVAAERLRSLVADSRRISPMLALIETAVAAPMEVDVA
jgi:uncharacterized OsmC-like protein